LQTINLVEKTGGKLDKRLLSTPSYRRWREWHACGEHTELRVAEIFYAAKKISMQGYGGGALRIIDGRFADVLVTASQSWATRDVSLSVPPCYIGCVPHK
jgi:hypothetical protein